MNTLEWTKIVGGLCGSLLVLLLIQWGSELTFHSSHKANQTASYYLEVEIEVEEEAIVEEIPFTEMVALANIDKGKKVFAKCKACHKMEKGVNGTGPYLYGVVGRQIASIENYSYSTALAEMGGVWSEEELNAFLLKPSKYAPGTKMSYAGLNPLKDRANLIAYLKTFED